MGLRGAAIGLIGASLVLIVAVQLLRPRGSPPSAPTPPVVSSTPPDRLVFPPSSAPESDASQAEPRPPAAAPGWLQRLRTAQDFHPIAQAALPEARAGHPEAQYALAEILHICDDGFRGYFLRGGRSKTLDEALLWASTRRAIDIEDVRWVHARCARLMTDRHEYGSTDEWIRRSADAGYAPAQARLAGRDLLNAYPAPDGASSAQKAAVRQAREAAISLLQTAVASGDLHALWEAGELQYAIRGDVDDVLVDQFAWMLAACKLGFDCSDQSRWYRHACHWDPNSRCQPGENGIDLIQRHTGSSFYEVQARAKRIEGVVESGTTELLAALALQGLSDEP